MASVEITLSEAEELAMLSICVDPNEWAKNAVQERIRLATLAITRDYTERALDMGLDIPSTRDDIVKDAFARGWAMTADDRSKLQP